MYRSTPNQIHTSTSRALGLKSLLALSLRIVSYGRYSPAYLCSTPGSPLSFGALRKDGNMSVGKSCPILETVRVNNREVVFGRNTAVKMLLAKSVALDHSQTVGRSSWLMPAMRRGIVKWIRKGCPESLRRVSIYLTHLRQRITLGFSIAWAIIRGNLCGLTLSISFCELFMACRYLCPATGWHGASAYSVLCSTKVVLSGSEVGTIW